MKRVLIFTAVLFTSIVSWASPPVFEMPVFPCTDAFSVPLTTYSWTLVPTANCSGRTLVVLNNPSYNTGNQLGVITNSSTAPSISTNTTPIELIHGGGDTGRGLSEESFLWMISLAASAESIDGQEFKQR